MTAPGADSDEFSEHEPLILKKPFWKVCVAYFTYYVNYFIFERRHSDGAARPFVLWSHDFASKTTTMTSNEDDDE